MCTLLSTVFVWFFINLPSSLFRFVPQDGQEDVDKPVSSWKTLENYSYDKYHSMTEVIKNKWEKVGVDQWFIVNTDGLKSLQFWNYLPVHWIQGIPKHQHHHCHYQPNYKIWWHGTKKKTNNTKTEKNIPQVLFPHLWNRKSSICLAALLWKQMQNYIIID